MTEPVAGTAFPEYAGGRLPVNAEQIELRLNEIWQQHAPDDSQEDSLIRLCLANILIVCDGSTRHEAENLAHRMAIIQPSRVILIVIDDSIKDYCAHVSTACNFSRGVDQAVCWEIIEIESDSTNAKNIPGALRSLIVSSISAITVDFRVALTSPQFDATLLDLSDYYFVNAELVPTAALEEHFLPLRWYRTLPLRELLSDFFSTMQKEHCQRYPVEFSFRSEIHPERLDVLAAGWIAHRLASHDQIGNLDDGLQLVHKGKPIKIRWVDCPDTDPWFVQIRFDNGSIGEVLLEGVSEKDPGFSLRYDQRVYQKRLSEFPLERYIIQSTRNRAEIGEYEATTRVVRQTAFG